MLAQEIQQRDVPRGSVSAWWLGGSGFIFKTSGGTQVYIDPYISNAAESIFGIKRAFSAPITSADAEPDIVISTHWHEDHLDPIAIPEIARLHPGARFVMPPSAKARTSSWGVPVDRISTLVAGQSLQFKDLVISAVPARHEPGIPGWEVPDAIGIVLQVDGMSIYHTGDTEYDVRLRKLRLENLMFATFCINGVGGNMNAREAAMLGWHLRPKILVPHHHLLWDRPQTDPEETLDPELFAATYAKLGGDGRVLIPSVGRLLSIGTDIS
jgi:L-ascorbate 6-phosphate lactonase